MPCFNPLRAWRRADFEVGPSGKLQLTFDRQNGIPSTEMVIACGQCIGCRLDRARQWAVRCMHEASLHDRNCFVTLTYNDEHLPSDLSLNKRDFVLFFKRFRKKYGNGIRYYQCGEYGDLYFRPHHHCIIFGFDFDDKQPFRQTSAGVLYGSDTLTALWGKGFCTIGDVTFDSACYVARYVMKKITGDKAEDYYAGRLPEYTTMSRRPGIGRLFYDKYCSDMYNYDKCVVRDNFVCKPPKYYDRLYDLHAPEHMADLKASRKLAVADKPDINFKRYEEKEKHLRLTLARKKRNLDLTD